MKKIIETTIANGSFNTLVTAVKAACLAETLSGPGPFTFFASNDEVVAKLPKGAVEGLLKDIPKLKKPLAYHVVAGKAARRGCDEALFSEDCAGAESYYYLGQEGIKVNDAKVIKKNIACDNGVIHVIDTVLTLPTGKSTAS